MKTKKLLFGMIEMNATLYNVLYTLLCVCVLLIVLIFSFGAITILVERDTIPDYTKMYMFLNWVMIIFIGDRMMNKKHYA
jgi:hypothetical protein